MCILSQPETKEFHPDLGIGVTEKSIKTREITRADRKIQINFFNVISVLIFLLWRLPIAEANKP